MQKRTKVSIIITILTVLCELIVIFFGFGFFTDRLVSSAIDDITKMTNILGYFFSSIGYVMLFIVSMLIMCITLTTTWVTWAILNSKQHKATIEKG